MQLAAIDKSLANRLTLPASLSPAGAEIGVLVLVLHEMAQILSYRL
jgi:hypothetical protein